MAAKSKRPARPAAVKAFLREADVSLRKIEEKFLQLAQCLREKRDIRSNDLKEMSLELRALHTAASKAGLKKTIDLIDHWEMLLEYACEHTVALDRKMADLYGEALETLESLTKDLDHAPEAKEATDVSRLIGDMEKITGKMTEKKKKEVSAQTVEVDQAYLGIYLDETEQNIAQFNDDLVILEKNPVDVALINNLFRIMHTIKGSSAMMNISDAQKIAHAMESVLVIARENHQAFAEMLPLLFGGIDAISNVIFSLRHKTNVLVDTVSLIEKLKQYAQSFSAEIRRKDDLSGMAVVSPSARELLAQALTRQDKIYRILIALDENTPLKGMKASLIEEHLNNRGVVIIMHPPAEEIHDLRRGQVKVGILFALSARLSTEPMTEQAGAQEIHGLLLIGGVSIFLIEPLETKDLAELLEKRSLLTSSEASQGKFGEGKPSVAQDERDLSAPAAPKPSLVAGKTGALTPFIRIDAKKLDTLMNLSGELVGIRAQYEGLVNQMRTEVSSGREFANVITALRANFLTLARELGHSIGKKEDAQAKYIFKELDTLREQLEYLEHTAGQSRLTIEVRRMDEMTGALGKVASYIQAAVMQARMVPIRGVFSRFNRIVRDVAHDLGKDVTLVLEGEETELDRNLIDGIAEPLIHMVRNAIDHGIEDTHTRRNAGKPECGTITLRAFHQGNNVCIEVADDGRGLDAQLLAANAIKKKLVSKEHVERLTEREKWDLIFLPGASTAARVTGISGRGVGMDAVRGMIGAMNGVIDIHSSRGRGTTFTFKIPLTLAIIQALLVAVADAIYALPLPAVMEITSVTPDMIAAREGHDTVQVRDHSVRLVDLKDTLHIHSTGRSHQGPRRAIILSDGERHAGIFVDKLIKETEVVIKALPHQFSRVKGFSGVTVLGDGQVALILDPKFLLA